MARDDPLPTALSRFHEGLRSFPAPPPLLLSPTKTCAEASHLLQFGAARRNPTRSARGPARRFHGQTTPPVGVCPLAPRRHTRARRIGGYPTNPSRRTAKSARAFPPAEILALDQTVFPAEAAELPALLSVWLLPIFPRLGPNPP